jgi:glycine C-acetyltransferase
MAYTEKIRNFLINQLKEIQNKGLYKEERNIVSPQAADIKVEYPIGAPVQEVINFCANNYLGLSSHGELIEAARKGLNSSAPMQPFCTLPASMPMVACLKHYLPRRMP